MLTRMFDIESQFISCTEKPRNEEFKQDGNTNMNTYYLALNTCQRIPNMHFLCGTGSWTTLRGRLCPAVFNMRHHRRLLRIPWQHDINNTNKIKCIVPVYKTNKSNKGKYHVIT